MGEDPLSYQVTCWTKREKEFLDRDDLVGLIKDLEGYRKFYPIMATVIALNHKLNFNDLKIIEFIDGRITFYKNKLNKVED